MRSILRSARAAPVSYGNPDEMPSSSRTRLFALYGLVSATIVLVDQVTKALVHQRMTLHESIPVIPDFFSLTYIRNPGAAFGLFVNVNPSVRILFFLSVTTVAIAVILYLFAKSLAEDPETGSNGGMVVALGTPRWIRLSLALVMGGAVGNVIDRIRYGEVIDFFDVYIGRYHWPAFNVADSAITVGVVLLFVVTLLPHRHAVPNSAPPKE
jgi:signal peptidase II